MKYVQVVHKITQPMKEALDETPRRGGLYNWIFAFKGSIMSYKEIMDNLEDYDVVQINMAPADIIIAPLVAEKLKNSSTKLVLNNDYVVECWDMFRTHPYEYYTALRNADMMFGTVPVQASAMGNGAFTFSHPHFVDFLKHYGNRRDKDGVSNRIGYLMHQWEGKTYLPSLILHRLREERMEFTSVIYNYDKRKDLSARWARCMWDAFIPPLTYPDFVKEVSKDKLLLELCQYQTYGRTPVDFASLELPIVGSDRVESMRRLFPNMCCNPIDVRKLMNLIKRVLNDEEWLDEQMKYAYNKVDYYNYKNSTKRYKIALEMAEDNKNKHPKGYYVWNDTKKEFELR